MSFLTGLFGGSDNLWLTVSVALALVLVLIVLAVWLLKAIFSATGKVTRGRNRRLGLVDTLPIDQKRHLLLIRRDGVEHLILAGGTHDLVVETNIEPPEQEEDRTARRGRTATQTQPKARSVSQAEPKQPAQRTEPAPAPRPMNQTGMRREPDIAPVQPTQPRTPSRAQPGDIASEPTIAPDDRTGEETAGKRGASLRYTGLLRPVSRMEPALIPTPDEKSPTYPHDSDMKSSDISADKQHPETAQSDKGASSAPEQSEDGAFEGEENTRT